jgi:aminoglycoside phosphotransferase family enzyme/predicted kinase
VIVEDQAEVRAFLADPANLGRPGPVEVIGTHISLIHMAGDRAWKLKRAVRLSYADFSTPELRLACCERELARNRLTAPDHYLAVRRITRTPAGGLTFDGAGPLVDAVVEMLRFDQGALLDALAARGALDRGLITALAVEIAAFHARAPVVPDPPGSAHVAAVLDVNEAALAETCVFPAAAVRSFNAAFRAGLDRHRVLLDARGRAGRVRLCHGDLHLRNIFLDRGRPVLFDCIEFNDAIATVDVLYDLAFLLMDLRQRGLDGFANLVLNRYLDATGDEDGLPLIPFFMALRAAVRAHVTATRIDTGGDPDGRLTAEAQAYFAMARQLLAPAPSVVVAIGGLCGSGKSTVAETLAPRIGGGAGARILSSDRLRKALFGVAPETRLPPEAYGPEVALKVYLAITARTGALASAGVTVVADAVFARPDERQAVEAAAQSAGVPFRGVWLELAPEALRARVAARRGGPSDADVAVLERQFGYDLGPMGWNRIDAEGHPETVAAAILRLMPQALRRRRA